MKTKIVEKGIDWKQAKEGDIYHSFSLSKFAGAIWELRYSRVQVLKINDKSLRLNRLDDNGGRGNEFRISFDKLKDRGRHFKTKKIAIETAINGMRQYADKAQKQLKGYTKKHPNYNWYVYTKNILREFYNLIKDGNFDREKYLLIKKNYSKYEEDMFKRSLTGK